MFFLLYLGLSTLVKQLDALNYSTIFYIFDGNNIKDFGNCDMSQQLSTAYRKHIMFWPCPQMKVCYSYTYTIYILVSDKVLNIIYFFRNEIEYVNFITQYLEVIYIRTPIETIFFFTTNCMLHCCCIFSSVHLHCLLLFCSKKLHVMLPII